MTSAPQATARERSIESAGVPLTVTEFPNPGRPPVVLLHGIASRGSSWWPVIDPLAARFHLYQLDLRGHGASGKPENGYSIEHFADDLEEVLDALELDEPRILGHSLGALVTLVWASEHPTRAAALVLEDPQLHIGPEVLDAFDGWQQLAALTPEAAAAWYRQEYPGWSDEDCLRRAETITSTAPGVFAELRTASEEALATGTTDRTHILASIQSPALLLRGNPELGGTVDPRDAERFLEIMPHGHVVSIPSAGHSLHRDASDAFLAAVIPFLEAPTLTPVPLPARQAGYRVPSGRGGGWG
jgi:pimeloyl-ACP methyl ester carboxylesterase